MKNRIAYLFGAGAEADYRLPQGDAFARETLLNTNKELFDALSDFYEGIDSCYSLENWISKYRGDTAFSKEMGRQIIISTVSSLVRINPNAFDQYGDSLQWVIDTFFSRGNYKDLSDEPILRKLEQNGWKPSFHDSNEDREELKEVLLWIEAPNSIPVSHKHAEVGKLIADEMKSYGVLEKYFYTVINPKKYGPYKFWKLVNYYWQSYFAIVVPVCEYLTKNGVQSFRQLGIVFDGQPKMLRTKHNYSVFLENIEFISRELWNRDNLESYRSHIGNNYYQHEMVKNAVGVITTNYTPIICSIYPRKLAQINGSLNLFEYPFELSVYDFCRDSRHPGHKMFFPFIFGTSSVKPVVHSLQIDALKNLKEILDGSDTLVIIGYGLNEDDNHLNSFIREFLIDQKDSHSHRVVYCYYEREKSIDEAQVKRHILSLLRIDVTGMQPVGGFNRLKILHNSGDTNDLFKKISESLEHDW